MRKLACAGIVLAMALAGQVWAQNQGQGQAQRYQGKPMPPNMPGNYTLISAAAMQAVMALPSGDNPVRVVDTPSGHYGIYVINYPPNPTQPGAVVREQYHMQTAEIYYILEGTGSFVLGGSMEGATESDPDSRVIKEVSGPSAGGTGHDFQIVRYSPGTIIMVPPGVPHNSNYDVVTPTKMMVLRIDPNKNITLK